MNRILAPIYRIVMLPGGQVVGEQPAELLDGMLRDTSTL